MKGIIKTIFFAFCFLPFVAHAEEGFYSQTLNHSDNKDHRVFQQRYIIDSSAASGVDAPVLYFIGNEAELNFLLDNTFIPELAHKLGAHFVALEHRYYGQSQPFDSLTTQHLQYLTFENALEDLAQFQRYITTSKGWRGKWIVIGKSYGANLAAFYRQKHPELVIGAIASSPALRAVVEWPEYDKRAAESAGRECVKKYRENVIAPLDAAMSDPSRMAELKSMFDAGDVQDNIDFLNTFGMLAAFMVSMNGPEGLCGSMGSSQPLVNFARDMQSFMHEVKARPVDYTEQGELDTRTELYVQGVGQRQWQYQECVEFGGFSTANPDTDLSFISTYAKNETLRTCQRLFGLQALPDVDATNRKYYLPLLDPATTNILVVNGSNDPVNTLSISHENGNDTNPNITIHTIDGGAHHSELSSEKITDSAAVKGARIVEVDIIKRWLALNA